MEGDPFDPSLHELAGIRALVTGSSRGIGEAIARDFARAGARLIIHASRSFDAAERLATELSSAGLAAVARREDLADPDACGRLVCDAFKVYGGLDVLVNNAGADILTGEARERTYLERLEDLLAVDVRATILLTRDAGRLLRTAGGGSIINVGWDGALSGMAGESGELFAAAKGAVMSFTKSAALSLAPEVRVNCIAPGWIRTAWGENAGPCWQERVRKETPLGRWGTPQEVAAVARFLASRAARFITGQILCVNGGSVR